MYKALNRLEIRSTGDLSLKELTKEYGIEEQFSFENIIPTPTDLISPEEAEVAERSYLLVHGDYKQLLTSYSWIPYEAFKTRDDVWEFMIGQQLPISVELANRYKVALEKYGVADVNNFRLTHWGVMEDCTDAKVLHRSHSRYLVQFTTQWHYPNNLIAHLSGLYPDLVITNVALLEFYQVVKVATAINGQLYDYNWKFPYDILYQQEAKSDDEEIF